MRFNLSMKLKPKGTTMKIENKHLKIAGWLGAGFALLSLSKSFKKEDAPQALNYSTIFKDKHMELRDYKPYRVAKVLEKGGRKSAVDDAFNVLFKYISGKNKARTKIPMTSPVTQMGNNGPWEINFIMPDEMSLEDLPKPNDKRVSLAEEKGGVFLVHKFSGLWNDKNIQKHKNHLDNYINNNGLKTDTNVIYAFYNSPCTLPWNRRNEIMYKVG